MTPHIEARKEEIAKNVIMPGDPLRAKYIADTFLKNPKLVNAVRGMYAYTGKYQGKEITVMASGMGIPSMGIYSYELYQYYGVENIIRIGTAGSYQKDIKIRDIILVETSYSKSSYGKCQNGNQKEQIRANQELNQKIQETAESSKMKLNIGTVLSSDVFYKKEGLNYEEYDKYKCLAVEMESFSLFANAEYLKKRAACLLTISDMLINIDNQQELTPKERQESLNDMIILALDSLSKFE